MAKKKSAKSAKKNEMKTGFDTRNFTDSQWETEEAFVKEVGCINAGDIKKAKISWQELACIYHDHESRTDGLISLGNTIAQILQTSEYVSSIKTRVKNPRSLIRKILRKRIERRNNVHLLNYREVISDLVGVRVLHVLKRDWVDIHKHILSTFKIHQGSAPVAYIAAGDENIWGAFYEENQCKCEVKETNYRSVHYDIDVGFTKEITRLEIQVRTINEEAWSELDHKINYPAPATPIVAEFIRAANALSSVADRLSQQIILVDGHMGQMNAREASLIQERDTALKQTKSLLGRLARTKAEKEEVRKSYEELEKTLNITKSKSQRIITDMGSGYAVWPLNTPKSASDLVTYNQLIVSDYMNYCHICREPLGLFHQGNYCKSCGDKK